jgi:hypothetical protein
MLCDRFLDNKDSLIPVSNLCDALLRICIPMSGRRIANLRAAEISIDNRDELMVELELCVSLLFKPLRHQVQNIIEAGPPALMSVWVPIMELLKEILNERSTNANEIIRSSNELIFEHLRNMVMVLINLDVLEAESSQSDGITSITWTTIAEIEGCKQFVEEWRQAAAKRQEG